MGALDEIRMRNVANTGVVVINSGNDSLGDPAIIFSTALDSNPNVTIFTMSDNNLDAINKKIINAADPINPQDVVTKAYGDANYLGGSGLLSGLTIDITKDWQAQGITNFGALSGVTSISMTGSRAITNVIDPTNPQDVVTLNYFDNNSYTHPNHTGDVTSVGDGATIISNDAVEFAKMQNINTAKILGRNSSGVGNTEEIDQVSSIEKTDGTEIALRGMSPADIKDMIAQHEFFTTVVKTADETISEDTVFHDDAELFLPVKANTTYMLIFYLFAGTGNLPDFKDTFSIPTGSTGDIHYLSDMTQPLDVMFDLTGIAIKSTTLPPPQISVMFGVLHVGATAGDLVYQWAQNTSDPTNTSVLKGSMLRLAEI